MVQHYNIDNWKLHTLLFHYFQCQAILFNSPQFEIINDIYDEDSRVIASDIQFYGTSFHLVNTYFPNVNGEKLNFIQNMYKYIMCIASCIDHVHSNLDTSRIDNHVVLADISDHFGTLSKIEGIFWDGCPPRPVRSSPAC